MEKTHPNITVLQGFDPTDVSKIQHGYKGRKGFSRKNQGSAVYTAKVN